MKYRVHYIIRPKPELLKYARAYAKGLEDCFQPEMWSGTEGGKTIWRKNDYLIRVRLLYLAALRDEVLDFMQMEGGRGSNSYESFMLELLGEPPYGAELFERYWTIEYAPEAGEDIDALETELSVERLRELSLPGSSLLAVWQDFLITDKTRSCPLHGESFKHGVPPWNGSQEGLAYMRLEFAYEHRQKLETEFPYSGLWTITEEIDFCPVCFENEKEWLLDKLENHSTIENIMTVMVSEENFVDCPKCSERFDADQPQSWDGERHHSCGQRLHVRYE